MSWKVDKGWFTDVNGIPVIKRDVGLGSTTYTAGYPKAVIFHYTAGCGSDISSVLKSRGISVTFSVDREGKVYEYLPLDVAGWHAFGMSHYAIGVEHTALPGSCDLTDVQLEASAKLMNAIRDYVKTKHGFTIPLKKLPAPVTLTNVQPGFFDHRDGASDWNENGHTDHLYRWTWKQYLAAIDTADTGGDEVAFAEFKSGVQASIDGKPLGDSWDPDAKFGWRLNERVKGAAKSPAPVPPGSVPPHSHTLEGTAK